MTRPSSPQEKKRLSYEHDRRNAMASTAKARVGEFAFASSS